MEIEVFLSACEKEKNKAKKEGQLDENEADPISFALHRMICVWALESKNIFYECLPYFNRTWWREV